MVITLKRTLTLIAVAGAFGCSVESGATRVAQFVTRTAQRCAIQVAMHRYAMEQAPEVSRPSTLRVQDPQTVEPAISRTYDPPLQPALSVDAASPQETVAQPLPIARDLVSIITAPGLTSPTWPRAVASKSRALHNPIVPSQQPVASSDCSTRAAA